MYLDFVKWALHKYNIPLLHFNAAQCVSCGGRNIAIFFLQLGEAVIKARGNGRALKNLKLSENIVVEILSESLNGVRKL